MNQMITFTTFLEILTTLAFIALGCMLAMMSAQFIFTLLYKQKRKKQKAFRLQRRQEEEQQRRTILLNKLTSSYKTVKTQNEYLTDMNEGLRRELKLYGEIRADMISYAIRLEQKRYDLEDELRQSQRELDVYKKELVARPKAVKAQSACNKTKADTFGKTKVEVNEQDEFLELELEPGAVVQAKGITFEEIKELPLIMQGKSQESELNAAITVAKANGTVLFDQFMEQVNDAKQNISTLIDRIDARMQKNIYQMDSALIENTFYKETGFSIRDFLPQKK